VRFASRVDGLLLAEDGSRQLRGVRLASGETLEARQAVLAVGHSARDTFFWLERQGVSMERKPFAVGLRIEHPQTLIDRARWGESAGHPRLGPAEYKLVYHSPSGRDVYSFCMCPGGWVVAATSEEGCVVTNGMSQHSRRERNANSGLVVNINRDDLEPWGRWPGDPLAGVAFQRHWERRAFAAGGGTYKAPAQTLVDFLSHQANGGEAGDGPPLGVEAAVRGSYLPGVVMTSLEGCLPDFVLSSIREALPVFSKSLPGYVLPEAILTGVETRTSSPLRLRRHPQTLQSENTPGLYPAGEGAGFAGGILSAAIDGLKVAEAVVRALSSPPRPLPGEPGGSVSAPT
jgi:uncharacterized FAD-dependent dehydrogenase